MSNINPYYYMGVNPTVDLMILSPEQKILLIKRSKKSIACGNMWALPGGFINTKAKTGEVWKQDIETPEKAAIRELKEETNLNLTNPYLIFIDSFEGNNRDPRDNKKSWSKSYAFIHIIDEKVYEEQKNKLMGLDDAEDVSWKSIKEISQQKLAFDHFDIINKGLKIVEKNKFKRKFI